MIRHLIALSAALFLAMPAAAQTDAPAPAPAPRTVKVAIETSEGRIVAAIEVERAPVTAANFLRYVDQKRLDGTVFYRSVQVQPRFGFVQFGVQNAPKRVLPPIKHEPTTLTGIKHLDGTLSIGRFEPGSARGDFTIMVGDQPGMDADPGRPGDNLGYAAFGRVVEGMEVVHKILDGAKKPGGYFKDQELVTPVKILSVRRVP
ncbi:MAG: peptidylprolyl isomerase [Sphingomonas sp.]